MTHIQWTNETWNPIVGCTIVSKGCTNCYAMAQAGRLLDGNPNTPHYKGTTQKTKAGYVWTGKVFLAPDKTIIQPMRWTRARMIFVNSMGDVFHEDVPNEWIDQIFAVMALSPQHTFQILTKRPERMRQYLAKNDSRRGDALGRLVTRMGYEGPLELLPWPLPNVWLGVSVEDQATADQRIPVLLNTPAALRWISAEPLLGPLDLTKVCLLPKIEGSIRAGIHIDALRGRYIESGCDYIGDWDVDGPCPVGAPPLKLDWAVVGGESGPKARPMHEHWPLDIRDACADAEVAFFFKQWGAWCPGECLERTTGIVDTASWFAGEWNYSKLNLSSNYAQEMHRDDEPDLYRGKGGDTLDGETYHNWPVPV